jgi:hypothetical protein
MTNSKCTNDERNDKFPITNGELRRHGEHVNILSRNVYKNREKKSLQKNKISRESSSDGADKFSALLSN